MLKGWIKYRFEKRANNYIFLKGQAPPKLYYSNFKQVTTSNPSQSLSLYIIAHMNLVQEILHWIIVMYSLHPVCLHVLSRYL